MDPFKAVHPFLSFGALAANVKHVIVQLAELEQGLCDSGGTKARTKNVLVGREVVPSEEPIDIGIIAAPSQWRLRAGHVSVLLLNIVVQRVLVSTPDRELHRGIFPKPFHRRQTLNRKTLVRSDVLRRRNGALISLWLISLELLQASRRRDLPRTSDSHTRHQIPAFLRR